MHPTKSAPIAIWWALWIAIILGLVIVYMVIQSQPSQAPYPNLRYLPILPLALSALVRWIVIPRIRARVRAFPMFVAGLALAEGCGMLGIFLVPDLKPAYLVLSLLGLAQFVPVFASRHEP